MSFDWPGVLGPLLAGESLSADQTGWAMERIMLGEATPAQFGAFVAGLRTKGETVEEIRGLVSTMRGFSLKVEVGPDAVDTCGTGGDRAGTLNVSTIAALVVAGAGVKVAKHGNRAATSASGSADLLEALGVKIDLGPDDVVRCIDEAGIGFCFAPVFHPSMRHAGPLRKELGVPTIFNFLGPLTNPAGVRRQAIGVSDPKMASKMIEVLNELGSSHVLMFHGSDGLDEITTTGPSWLWELQAGSISENEIDPSEFGVLRSVAPQLKGGSPKENAAVTVELLNGLDGPARDIVSVNAAAGLVAADSAGDFKEGLAMAAESIDSGRAADALQKMIEVSNSAS
jgi:anthranilate phosphoribosyltransferase